MGTIHLQRAVSGVVCALAAVMFAAGASGQVLNESAKLLASDAAARDNFGFSVSASGDTAVVGAFQDNDAGSASGSAYVFEIDAPIPDCNENGIDDAEEIADCDGDPACGDCDLNEVPDGCQEDADGDGVIDACDVCPQSEPDGVVTIRKCDTGVANLVFDDGCTMADVLAECHPDPVAGRGGHASKNRGHHGDFVTCINETARAWRSDGIITGAEFGRLVSCAAKSDVGRGRDTIESRKTGASPKE